MWPGTDPFLREELDITLAGCAAGVCKLLSCENVLEVCLIHFNPLFDSCRLAIGQLDEFLLSRHVTSIPRSKRCPISRMPNNLLDMNVAKAILKNIGLTVAKEDTESSRDDNPEGTEIRDKVSVPNTAMLAAQSAVRPHTEMQMDSQPALHVTTRSEEDHQQQSMSRENPRQSGKKVAATKRNSVIGGREETSTDRNANSKDTKIAQLENYISQLSQTHATKLAELHARVEQSEREKEEYVCQIN